MTTQTSPRRQSSKSAAAPRRALLRQRADGTIEALSQRGPEIYTIVLGDAPSCTCLGWQNHGHCYHLTDAARRFPAFYSRPQLPARRAASVDLLYA